MIPRFYETFMPILEILKDGRIIKVSDLPNRLLENNFFKLTLEEMEEKTTSGTRLYFNRVNWGKAYLKQGKFVEQPERGLVKITEKGGNLLDRGEVLTLDKLRQDIDFIAHRERISVKRDKEETAESESTPQDKIDAGFQEIQDSLKSDLLEKLKTIDPYYFEDIILILFRKMGYGDFKRTSRSNDGGIDGIINQDKLGVDKIYTQAKRYSNHQVGRKDMTNFIGAMSRDGVSKGIFVTTGTFNDRAKEAAKSARDTIILIDGEKLADLMVEYNIGVQVKANYKIKEIDEDFFEEIGPSLSPSPSPSPSPAPEST